MSGFQSGRPVDLIVVGKVIEAYGLKGGIKVQPFSQDPRALLETREWWLGSGTAVRDFEVYSARIHAKTITAQLVGIVDRDAAESFKGCEVSVPRAKFPALSESEYYWVDLIGLEVKNPQGELLGEVTKLLDHSAHPILEVALAGFDGDPTIRLIPFVAAIVLDVDLVERRIVADWQLDY